MAEIKSIISGTFEATPGNAAHMIELPPGQIGLFAILHAADPADVGSITFGTQGTDVEGWTATSTYSMEWTSSAAGNVTVHYWLLVTDVNVPRLGYGGV